MRNSALDDLRCAHAIGEELALLGQEALSQLGAGRLAEEAQIQERMAAEAATRQAKIQPPIGDAHPLQEFSDQVAAEPAPAPVAQEAPAPEPSPSIDNSPPPSQNQASVTPQPAVEDPPARSPVPSPEELMSTAEQFRKEFEASMAASADSPEPTVISGAVGAVIEAEPAPEAPSSPPLSAAEELQREMAGMQPTPVAAEPAAASIPEASDDPPSDGSPLVEADAVPSIPLPEEYSGKIYLMFPSTLDQDQVGSIWEALDDLAGSGAIVDSRLVSQDEGVQFTLELGSKALTMDALKKKMPGADLTALEADRLKVNWPKPR